MAYYGFPSNAQLDFPTLAVGDFDNDGHLDVAYAHTGASKTARLEIFRGSREGRLHRPIAGNDFPGVPQMIAVADFNRDGNLDLAVPVAFFLSDPIVDVFLGKGDSTFQDPSSFPAGPPPNTVTVGDFNGDLEPDVVVTNAADLNVLFGTGKGTFREASPYGVVHESSSLGLWLATNQPPVILPAVATGDFNGDGRLDFAVATHRPGLAVLLGAGDAGLFAAPVKYPTARNTASAVVSADFNDDKIPDLAATDNDGVLTIFLGKSDGSFTKSVDLCTESPPSSSRPWSSLAVADVDGDGRPDLIAEGSSHDRRQLFVFLSNADGSFEAATIESEAETFVLVTGDFNGDGRPDLAYLGHDSKLHVLLNESCSRNVVSDGGTDGSG